jgi:hypothetical protein
VAAEFDRSLALLHNFWYARALEHFSQVARDGPECAMAYWGAAMTYIHPFWDPPSQADEAAAWALVQKRMGAQKASAREKLYVGAVAELYKDAGSVGTRSERNERYRDAMAAAYDKYPDDETILFYGLSVSRRPLVPLLDLCVPLQTSLPTAASQLQNPSKGLEPEWQLP